MGASNFMNIIWKSGDVMDVYNQVCEQEAWEYGHNPYNGTIATTSGVYVLSDEPLPLEEAERLKSKAWDNEENWHKHGVGKWERCYAIPLKENDKEGWMFFGLAAT